MNNVTDRSENYSVINADTHEVLGENLDYQEALECVRVHEHSTRFGQLVQCDIYSHICD